MKSNVLFVGLCSLALLGCAQGTTGEPPSPPVTVDSGPPPIFVMDSGPPMMMDEEPPPKPDGGEDPGMSTDSGSGGSDTDAGSSSVEEDAGSTEMDAGSPPMMPCNPQVMTGMTATGMTDGTSNVMASCGGRGPEQAFLFTPTSTGMFRVHTEGSSMDTVLAVFQGNDCMGMELGCNDDIMSGNRASEVNVQMTAGQPITIVVDSFSATGGEFSLAVTDEASSGPMTETNCTDGMDNDGDMNADCADSDCSSASNCMMMMTPENCTDGMDNDGDMAVDCADSNCTSAPNCAVASCAMAPEGRNLETMVGMGVAMGTTTGLMNDYSFASCRANTAPDIVYRWVAPSTGMFQIDTCGSSFDTVLFVSEANCSVTTPIVCNDDSCSLQSQVTLSATAGHVYHIGVDGYSTRSGNYVLNIVRQ